MDVAFWTFVVEAVGAAGTLAAVGTAIWGTVKATRAADTANNLAREAAERAEAERKERSFAEVRQRAGQLQVWWAEDPKTYLDFNSQWVTDKAVVIENVGLYPVVFSNVAISYMHNKKSIFLIPTVPPGRYITFPEKSTPRGLRPFDPDGPFIPLNSYDYRVVSVEYTDSLGYQWQWTPQDFLQLVSAPPEAVNNAENPAN